MPVDTPNNSRCRVLLPTKSRHSWDATTASTLCLCLCGGESAGGGLGRGSNWLDKIDPETKFLLRDDKAAQPPRPQEKYGVEEAVEEIKRNARKAPAFWSMDNPVLVRVCEIESEGTWWIHMGGGNAFVFMKQPL
jgi:hypothetical protein